ncbi:MAG: DUF1570 domain-containing protein [Planctomycetes bacterium]|nr:DUF1570 domain-containing protein [Planctomycetota bacterium]MCB9904406.1 DUF1570 domain-containing protein [Planctomycetota bacterium]
MKLFYAACGLAALSLAAPANADRVLTEDGRIIKPLKAREEGDGYRLTFEIGEIVTKDKKGIASIEIEGDMSDYVPQNEDEAQKLADGYIRYDGKWWSKPAYEAQLKKEFEESRERTQELAEHSEWHNAWSKETRHFVFRTNTSPELLDYYAELLETYYGMMDKRVGIKPKGEYRKIKMTVNIYKSREEFHELNAAGVGGGVAGYFWSYDNTLNFYHDYEEPAVSDWVGLHECTHLLTFLIDQEYQSQIWLNEGVADFFGSADVKVEKKKGKFDIEIVPGKLQTDRVLTVQQAIKEKNDIKLEDLFFINRRDFHSFQYAHAWSFVYFLNNYDKGKYQKGFTKFFKALYTLEKGVPYERVPAAGKTGTGKSVTPEDIRALLLEKIKVDDVAALEKEWKEFIAAIPVDGPEARLKRGLRAVYQWEFEEALPDLNAAIEAGIQDPRAYWGRGRAKLWSGKGAESVSDFEKAVEMDPLSASFRYALSEGLAFKTIFTQEGKVGNPDARLQAGLAHELDPENERYREWFEEMAE